MIESTLLIVAIIAMSIALTISAIPLVPGPALLWAIGTLFAILTDFERVTVFAVLVMTLLMILGSTTELWLRYFGMRSRGASCWSTVGSLIGALVGTAILPIIGTLIGAIIGALAIELVRIGELRQAIQAGKSAFEIFILSLVVEFGISIAIFLVFLISLWMTA